jgi:hypothetical protein
MNRILDIEDRRADYVSNQQEAVRSELGFRAIAMMYDDHSSDQNSFDNIVKMKDNIQYWLFSASHQYLVFLRELEASEQYLMELQQENPRALHSFLFSNPYVEKVEQELSSVFDNIVFQVASLFDYVAHVVCYITFRDKLTRFIGINLPKQQEVLVRISWAMKLKRQ